VRPHHAPRLAECLLALTSSHWTAPLLGLRPPGASPVPALLDTVSRPFAKRVLRFRIAVIATGRGMLAPDPRIERAVGPLDFAGVAHEAAQSVIQSVQSPAELSGHATYRRSLPGRDVPLVPQLSVAPIGRHLAAPEA